MEKVDPNIYHGYEPLTDEGEQRSEGLAACIVLAPFVVFVIIALVAIARWMLNV